MHRHTHSALLTILQIQWSSRWHIIYSTFTSRKRNSISYSTICRQRVRAHTHVYYAILYGIVCVGLPLPSGVLISRNSDCQSYCSYFIFASSSSSCSSSVSLFLILVIIHLALLHCCTAASEPEPGTFFSRKPSEEKKLISAKIKKKKHNARQCTRHTTAKWWW